MSKLTKAEGEELRALRELPLIDFYDHPGLRVRLSELQDRALLYGCEGVEARPFAGLEPRCTLTPVTFTSTGVKPR